MIGELEFAKVDLAIGGDGSHLRIADVEKDVAVAAHQVRIGPSLAPAAFQITLEENDVDEAKKQLQSICKLARHSSVAILTLMPPDSSSGIDAEVDRLTELVHLAEKEGVVLTVPTRVGYVTEMPDAAVELCRRVPGLGLTLDPSHYIAGPNQGKCHDVVYPHVRHVHLRDTGRGAGQFQVRVGQGEIEYGRIIAQLAKHGYQRLLTIDIREVADGHIVVEHEVRKLKYLLESLI